MEPDDIDQLLLELGIAGQLERLDPVRFEAPLASSAQLGPPSSVEPTVRPGLARRVAVKRGRDAAARLPNNPETGCKSRDR